MDTYRNNTGTPNTAADINAIVNIANALDLRSPNISVSQHCLRPPVAPGQVQPQVQTEYMARLYFSPTQDSAILFATSERVDSPAYAIARLRTILTARINKAHTDL